MSYRDATILRQRAVNLRELSRRMRDSPSMSLHLHAGIDTWYGPRAAECVSELARAQRGAHDAADGLDAHAFRLERHADELAALALRADQLDGLQRR